MRRQPFIVLFALCVFAPQGSWSQGVAKGEEKLGPVEAVVGEELPLAAVPLTPEDLGVPFNPEDPRFQAGALGTGFGWAAFLNCGTANQGQPDSVSGVTISGSSFYPVGTMGGANTQKKFLLTRYSFGGAYQNNIRGNCDASFGTHVLGQRNYRAGDGHILAVGSSRCGTLSGGAVFGSCGQTKHIPAEYDAEGFVIKLDASCLKPLWWEAQRGGGEEKTEAVVADGYNVWVAGHSNSSHLYDRKSGERRTFLALRGGYDVWLLRYGSGGGWPTGAVGVGGSADDGKPFLALYGGYVYLAGYFRSSNLVVYNGSGQVLASIPKVGGGSDIFVVKLTSDLRTVVWARAFGSPGDDKVGGLAVRGSDVYVGGYFEAGNLALPGCCSVPAAGGRDGFGIVMNASNGAFFGGMRVGGTGDDEVLDVAVVPTTGKIYLTGNFSNTLTVGPYSLTSRGGRDGFLLEVDRNGVVYFLGQAGGSGRDEGAALAISGSDVVVVGNTESNPLYVGTATLYRPSGCSSPAVFGVKLTHY